MCCGRMRKRRPSPRGELTLSNPAQRYISDPIHSIIPAQLIGFGIGARIAYVLIESDAGNFTFSAEGKTLERARSIPKDRSRTNQMIQVEIPLIGHSTQILNEGNAAHKCADLAILQPW